MLFCPTHLLAAATLPPRTRACPRTPKVAKGDRQTPQLDGFHFLLRGIELDKLYVRGWRGNYEAILRGTSARERVQHWCAPGSRRQRACTRRPGLAG